MNIENLNTWLEISEDNYRHNLSFFKSNIPAGTELSVVVKSNAYGHGLREIAGLALKHGADSFCVHSIEEALNLRELFPDANILILGYVPLARLRDVVAGHFRLAVFTPQTLQKMDQICRELQKPARIHLKLETGTYRQGVEMESVPDYLSILRGNNLLELEAAYTHFANIEDTTNHDFALAQLARF